jgi:hypothetical protein
MPHWLIKSVMQRALSWLPASHYWNTLCKQYVTRSLELAPPRFDLRLKYARAHLDHLLELRPNCKDGFTVLEIGTGWYPVVPAALYLCGASEVWTLDIVPLLRSAQLKRMLELFLQYERSGALQKFLPRLRPERLKRLLEVASQPGRIRPTALLEQLNIHVRTCDARNTGLASGTIDLIASTSVLEYISRKGLRGILAECRRVGSVNATHSHYLNLADEYSYFDPSITPLNFLQYSDKQWRYYNSPLAWQNRLRISDYRALFAEAGYQTTKEDNTSAPPETFQRVRLAPQFQQYRKEDLLVIISWLVAKPLENWSPAGIAG